MYNENECSKIFFKDVVKMAAVVLTMIVIIWAIGYSVIRSMGIEPDIAKQEINLDAYAERKNA